MTQSANTGAANAGWHPDPTGRHQHRYFDGTQWTHHVADNGRGSTDPVNAPPKQEVYVRGHCSACGETVFESEWRQPQFVQPGGGYLMPCGHFTGDYWEVDEVILK